MSATQKPNTWLPLIGDWDLSNPTAVHFNGRPYVPPDTAQKTADDPVHLPPDQTPSHGVALSDLTFSGGAVEAEITFHESETAVGELILAYNPTTREMLTAGIGGWPGMFSVREWVRNSTVDQTDSQSSSSPMRWNTLEITGDRLNIESDKPYHLRASIRGSQIALTVNGIQVISTQRRGILPQPSSAGLFCGSVKTVKAANFVVTPEPPHAFVVMQFSAPYTDVYLSVIKSVCAEFGITAIRADEIYGPGVIVHDIVEQVVTAQLVIADISVTNANVYFEVGYALASKKPLLLLAKKGTTLPFDISGFRVLFYEDSIGGKAKVEDGLRKHLTALLGPAGTPLQHPPAVR